MAVGFALAWMVVPTVGKRVFLRVVSTIPTIMRCMTTAAATVKKTAFGRSKSPAFAGTKTAANRGPSPNPPQGAGVPSCCVLGGYVVLFPPWGRLGWGFYVGWYAPPTTLTELRLHSPELRLPSPLGESWRGASAFYLLSYYTKRGATRRFPPTWCGLLVRAPRCSLY